MLNRRTLLKGLCASCSLALVPGKCLAAGDEPPVKRFRVWDQHAHLGAVPGGTPEERMAFLVRCMDRVGVERLIISQGYSADKHPNPPEQFRLENDRVMRAVEAFPDRAFGSVYITPALLDFSMQELDRCVRNGPMVMIGEIEAEARCNVKDMDTIAEWAVAMEVTILQHEWLNAKGNGAGESTPFDVVELAKRHPKLQIAAAPPGRELGTRHPRHSRHAERLCRAGGI